MIPGMPSLSAAQTAQSGADGDINGRTEQDRSGIFEQGRITVATGKGSISQSTSASDGGTGLNPWLIGGGVVAIGAFVFFLARKTL